MTLCRRDCPMILALVILVVLLAFAASARAQDHSAIEQVANEVASQVSSQVAAPGWMSLLGNLTVAGILWYYSRLFYDEKIKADLALRDLTAKFHTLAAESKDAMREMRMALDRAGDDGS